LLIALFLLPALILFLLFVIYPIFRSIYFSMFDWNGLGPAVDFVGLENFKTILPISISQGARNYSLDRASPAASAPIADIGGIGGRNP
jgi:raffinose/stachyose/melibiose transport system permease protein